MVESKRLAVNLDLDRSGKGLIYDPQTSGGLLLALPADQADALLIALHEAGVSYAVKVGEVTDNSPGVLLG